jgi:hypothetical protein
MFWQLERSPEIPVTLMLENWPFTLNGAKGASAFSLGKTLRE